MPIMAAKGRLPDKAPQVTLDEANTRQARINATVEITTVAKLLPCGGRNVFRSSGKTTNVLADRVTVQASFNTLADSSTMAPSLAADSMTASRMVMLLTRSSPVMG